MRSIPTISSWRLNWLSKLKEGWLHFSILHGVPNNLVVVYFHWGCILAYNVSIFSSFNSVLISIVVHCVYLYFFALLCSSDLESAIFLHVTANPFFRNFKCFIFSFPRLSIFTHIYCIRVPSFSYGKPIMFSTKIKLLW